MFPSAVRRLAGAALAALLLAVAAQADVASLWYREAPYEGRIYVFNDPAAFEAWQASRVLPSPITRDAWGPNGETVVFDGRTALELYAFKHDRPAEPPAAPAPKASPVTAPGTLKVGDGELKLGVLLQAWFVGDDSPQGPGTDYLGNPTGVNTVRIRRAEIRFSGKVARSWGFDVQIDPAKTQVFASGGDDKILQDAFVSFLGLAGHELALGQKKIALTEEGLRSSADIDFAERARITRVVGDQRQLGFFYRGELGKAFAVQASATSGLPSNVSGTSDRLFVAGRLDVKPAKGLLVGVSGGTGAQGTQALTRDRLGAHVRWDGTEALPLMLRAEYGMATDGQADGAEIDRDGFYVSALYTLAKRFRVGLRYEGYDPDDAVAGDELRVVTGGLHYMIRGRSVNLKLEWYGVEQEGRRVGGVPAERYDELVLAAQVSF